MEELWPGGPRYAHVPGLFPPGSDTVWLSDFIRLTGVRTLCDLGCGGGLLSLRLLGRKPELRVSALDILPEAVACTRENAARNGWEIEAVCADLRDCKACFRGGSFDLAVSNPPFFAQGRGGAAAGARGIARQETCTLGELCRAAAYLVKNGGRFALVYRPARLGELLCEMTAAGLEPKRLCLVHKDAKSPPGAVLLEGKKGGGRGLEILPPLLTG